MAKQITGLEFKKFYFDENILPDNMYIDDMSLLIDNRLFEDIDVSDIKDNAIIKINSGMCLDYNDDKFSEDLIKRFTRWRKHQDEIIVNVICNKKNINDLKEFLDLNKIKYRI